MNIKILLAATLICFGLAVEAEDRIVSQAYEVALSDFRAPATPNGGVAFKPCSSCARISVRVTPATRYAINGKSVRLVDFRTAVRQASDRDKKGVLVLHHLESDTIKSLDVSI